MLLLPSRTRSNIAFEEMRIRTGIPFGDLFTVMENWRDAERVRAAMEVIHELEARALTTLQLAPGLEALLQQCIDDGLRIAIVTRNTPAAVDALFARLGESWRPRFDPILTRHFTYVKPDRRLLLHVAQQWGCPPSDLLMVGDSREDVEIGAICGAATCLIAGGGNEAFVVGSDGIVPTFAVASLHELAQRLRPSGDADIAALAPPAGLPPGVAFVDWMLQEGHLSGAACSYPLLGSAAGGLQGCAEADERVLHIDCGDGSLTKTLHSHGVAAQGADADADAVHVATRRGLHARVMAPLSVGALGDDAAFDAVVCVCAHLPRRSLLFADDSAATLRPEALPELARALRPGGRVAIEWASAGAMQRAEQVCHQLQQAGFAATLSTHGAAVRLVAVKA